MSRTTNGPRHSAGHSSAGRRSAGRSSARRLAAQRSAGRPAPRHAATPAPVGAHRLLLAAGALALGTVVVLSGSGSTLALWSASRTVTGPTITSGSTGLTINGQMDHVLAGLGLAALAPGRSALAPLTLRNTGTTPVAVRVAGTDITDQTKGLAASLTVSVTPSLTCAAGLPGSQNGALAGFTTPSPLSSLPAGAELLVCLEVRLDPAAPPAVQGGAAGFVMTFEATQERPS
jgi:hypothetical protein